LTIIFAILVSLLVSFTLTPMMASIFLKPHQKSMSNPLAAGMSGSGQKTHLDENRRLSGVLL